MRVRNFQAIALRFDPGYLAAALLPLIGILPTIGDGVIKAADGPLHVQRIFAMTTLLKMGDLWPRWVPWFHLGFGYPVFDFYPPGVFYIGGLLGVLGVSAVAAFTVIAAMAWIIGSVGMYALARRMMSGAPALLAAMLWSYAPSRLYEIWHQGSLPQMMSGAFVPWIFWGVALAAERPTRRSALALALAFIGLVMTHQPVALVTALFVGPASLLIPLWLSRRDWRTLHRRLAAVFGGFALGVGLAGIFLIPLAGELKYIAGDQTTADTIPYLISNYLRPQDVFSQPLPADLTDLRFELPTTLGLVGGLMAALGFVALLRRKQFALAVALLAATAFMVFLLLQISLPVWEKIPYLVQLRFPARLLRVGAVFIALAGGASILLLPRRWQPVGLAAGLVIALVSALPLVYPNQMFVNWPNLSALDEIQLEQTAHIWGTTSYDEFDPIWGQRIPLPPGVPEPQAYITDPTKIVVDPVDMARQGMEDFHVQQLASETLQLTMSKPRAVRFYQYYFPGWTATMDGQPADIYPDDQYGLITLDMTPGQHVVSLEYSGTAVQKVGTVVTLVSIALSVVLLLNPTFRSQSFIGWFGRHQLRSGSADAQKGVPTDRPSDVGTRFFASVYEQPPRQSEGDLSLPRQTAWAVSAAVIVFALVNTIYITPDTTWFRYKSPPNSPAYMQTPVHASFGDTFELLGYTLNQDSAAPGETIDIMIFWRAMRNIDRQYRPVIQLVNLSQSQAWAVSQPFFPGGGQTVGYPTDRFASEIDHLKVFDDTPPYVGRIAVQMVQADSGEPLRLADGSDRILLSPIIRIRGNGPAIQQTMNDHTDAAEFQCASVQSDGNQYMVDLYWHVVGNWSEGVDFSVFVHGLDASGNTVAQNDGPVMGGDYPARFWLIGQNLLDRHTLPFNSAIANIAVGLYTADARLTVTQNGQPVADNQIVLPLTQNSCSP